MIDPAVLILVGFVSGTTTHEVMIQLDDIVSVRITLSL